MFQICIEHYVCPNLMLHIDAFHRRLVFYKKPQHADKTQIVVKPKWEVPSCAFTCSATFKGNHSCSFIENFQDLLEHIAEQSGTKIEKFAFQVPLIEVTTTQAIILEPAKVPPRFAL